MSTESDSLHGCVCVLAIVLRNLRYCTQKPTLLYSENYAIVLRNLRYCTQKPFHVVIKTSPEYRSGQQI